MTVRYPDLRRSWRVLRLAASIVCLASIPIAPGGAGAATPSSGSLSSSNPSVAWSGGVIAGANANESSCQEGVTCETFTLTLQPGNYTGKRIVVGISWTVPADDYDLYVNTPSGVQV